MIEPLRPAHIDACASLLGRLPEWFGIEASNAQYVESLHHLPAFVGLEDGHVVGFLALHRHGPRSAEITVMAVDPGLHRRGIGGALVAAAEGWCTENGVEWLHVKTRGPSTYDDHYERTRRFYTTRGFDALYESLTEWGPSDAALILVKHLTCSQ